MRSRPASRPILLSLLLLTGLAAPAFSQESPFSESPGRNNVKYLIARLSSANREEQLKAILLLAEMGPAAEDAVPSLVNVVRSGNSEARVLSSIALVKIDPYMKDFIPVLLQSLEVGKGEDLLEDSDQLLSKQLGLSDDLLRKWSALMRSKVDPRIMPLLEQTLKDQDRDIRTMAVLILAGISNQVPSAFQKLLQAYQDPDPEVRGAVIRVLPRVGMSRAGALQALLAGLKDPQASVRVRTVIALSRVGPQNPAVLPAIMRALEDKSDEVRTAALKSLELLGDKAKSAAPRVADQTGKGTPQERLAAASTAIRLDPSQAIRVTPLLTLLFQDSSLELSLRLQAADLLQKSGTLKNNPRALTDSLGDPVPEIRNRAVQLLAQAGAPAAPLLLRSLQNGRSSVRVGAIQALIDMRPIPPELVPALIATLKDKEPSLRYLATEGLERLGSLGQDAIPTLIEALYDGEESIRSGAGNALLAMGPPAMTALEAAAKQTENLSLKSRAALLLKKANYEPT